MSNESKEYLKVYNEWSHLQFLEHDKYNFNESGI